MEEAINGINIDNCIHPCAGQPCLNGGRCIAMKQNYKCSCPLGFENSNCEDSQYCLTFLFHQSSLTALFEVKHSEK